MGIARVCAQVLRFCFRVRLRIWSSWRHTAPSEHGYTIHLVPFYCSLARSRHALLRVDWTGELDIGCLGLLLFRICLFPNGDVSLILSISHCPCLHQCCAALTIACARLGLL